LSPKGRNEELERLRKELRPSVREFEQERDNFIEMRQREIAKRDDQTPTDREEAVQEARAREVRESLRGKDQGEIVKVYQNAAERGDLETVKALEDQPLANPVVDPDALAKVREARLGAKFPEATAKIANQQALVDLLDNMATYLSRRIEA